MPVDLTYVAILLGFSAACYGFIVMCDRLMGAHR